MGRLLLEKYIQAVRLSGLNTNKDAYFGGNVTIVGTLTAGQEVIGAETITSTSANAFAVGRQGTTAPVLNIDASASNVATGLNIAGAAAGSAVTLSVISSGTNENLIISPKGTGVIQVRIPAAGATQAAQLNIMNSDGSQRSVAFGNTNTDGTTSGTMRIYRGGTQAGEVVALSTGGVAVNSAAGVALRLAQSETVSAGGSVGGAVIIGGTSGFGIYVGSGAPTVSAAKGSLYLRTDGTTTNDRMYVNTNGTTTWTAVTTVA